MRSRRRSAAVLLAVLALVAGACGGDDGSEPAADDSTPVDQTIDIKMVDVAFDPDLVTLKAGSTVRFRFVNDGRTVHDAHFGDDADQEAVEDGKKSRNGPELGPNASKSFVYTFSGPGQVIIGCHQPGHYRQGMKARITVS